MKFILDILYFLGLLLYSPVIILKSIFHGRYRKGHLHRLGLSPRSHGLQPAIWIHGVSVGEINATRPLVREIHSQLPDYRVVISTTTDTGMETALRIYGRRYTIFRWPLDFSWSTSLALSRVKPDLVVLMEGEVWPNFLANCNRRNIPVMVANGRISPDKGYPRYKMLGSIATRMFNRLSAIGVQDEIYAEKFISLGMDEKKIHLTGMLKFESIDISDTVEGQDEMATALGLQEHRQLLVAGGTGNDEEGMILDAWDKLKQERPDLRLAIVPRKPERFEEVARLISSRGYELVRRSSRPDGTDADTESQGVILGDTMGELTRFYALASVVFTGRSLVPMGGSDMIEPAALGKPVCFGPHTFNFPQAEGLLAHGCRRVENVDQLVDCVHTWLQDSGDGARAGRQAQQFVRNQKGAAKRNVVLMCHLLGKCPPLADGTIATDMIEEVDR